MSDLTGIVMIAYEPIGGTYHGYWEPRPDARPATIIPTPASRDAEEVVRWARERAARISIRLPDGKHYWAGDGPLPLDYDGVWTAELSREQGNPLLDRTVPGDAPGFWVLRCKDCGLSVSGDSEEGAKAAVMAHWTEKHHDAT